MTLLWLDAEVSFADLDGVDLKEGDDFEDAYDAFKKTIDGTDATGAYGIYLKALEDITPMDKLKSQADIDADETIYTTALTTLETALKGDLKTVYDYVVELLKEKNYTADSKTTLVALIAENTDGSGDFTSDQNAASDIAVQVEDYYEAYSKLVEAFGITVDTSDENGSVFVTVTSPEQPALSSEVEDVEAESATAAKGETVTVTVISNYGYELAELTVSGDKNEGTWAPTPETPASASGKEDIVITVEDDGTYTFTMPAEAVTITAEFAPIVVGVTMTSIEAVGKVEPQEEGSGVTTTLGGEETEATYSVKVEANAVFTITPAEGYKLGSVTLSGIGEDIVFDEDTGAIAIEDGDTTVPIATLDLEVDGTYTLTVKTTEEDFWDELTDAEDGFAIVATFQTEADWVKAQLTAAAAEENAEDKVVILSESITIAAGETVTVPEGVTLTVAADVTLTVADAITADVETGVEEEEAGKLVGTDDTSKLVLAEGATVTDIDKVGTYTWVIDSVSSEGSWKEVVVE